MCSFCNDHQYDRELAHKAARKAEEEPQNEMDLRVSGPTLAESMRRLARAIERRTEELLRPHLEREE